jgi:hypothetical protein
MKTDLKTVRQYQISYGDYDYTLWKSVNGYRVIYEELPDIEFFVYNSNYGWRVSEVKTGSYFTNSEDGETRQEAINKAHNWILKHTVKKFKTLYKKHLKRIRS